MSVIAMMLGTMAAQASGGLGPELVTNGGFDADSDWTKGLGWSISGGVASKLNNDISSSITNSATVVSGKTYRVSFRIVSGTASVTPRLGTQNGTARSGVGSYTQDIVANGTTIAFVSGANFGVSIDDVSVREVL